MRSVCSLKLTADVSVRSVTEEKRQSSTFVACSENRAKLTPPPSHVAPRGFGLPGQTRGSISLSQSVKKFSSNPGVDHFRHTYFDWVWTHEQVFAFLATLPVRNVANMQIHRDSGSSIEVRNPRPWTGWHQVRTDITVQKALREDRLFARRQVSLANWST